MDFRLNQGYIFLWLELFSGFHILTHFNHHFYGFLHRHMSHSLFPFFLYHKIQKVLIALLFIISYLRIFKFRLFVSLLPFSMLHFMLQKMSFKLFEQGFSILLASYCPNVMLKVLKVILMEICGDDGIRSKLNCMNNGTDMLLCAF